MCRFYGEREGRGRRLWGMKRGGVRSLMIIQITPALVVYIYELLLLGGVASAS